MKKLFLVLLTFAAGSLHAESQAAAPIYSGTCFVQAHNHTDDAYEIVGEQEVDLYNGQEVEIYRSKVAKYTVSASSVEFEGTTFTSMLMLVTRLADDQMLFGASKNWSTDSGPKDDLALFGPNYTDATALQFSGFMCAEMHEPK